MERLATIGMKILLVSSSCLIIGACSSVGEKSSTASQQEVVQQTDSKLDLKKAAKLNVAMGEQYLAQGQVSRAKSKFFHALKLRPNMPEALTSLGYFFETVGDAKEAERYYKKAISNGGGQASFYNNYGNFLCREKKYLEADKAFQNALKDKTYTATAEVYENAGLCALRAADLDKGRNYLKVAVRYDPRRAIAPLEVSELAFNQEDYQEAWDYLQTFNSHNKPTARSLWLSIQVAKKIRNFDKVASDALLLKNMFESSPEYRLYLDSLEKG